MSAEAAANLGIFEARKAAKRKFDEACVAMESAMSSMQLNTSPTNISRGSEDEAVDILASDATTPLLNNVPLTHAVAETILAEVKKLQAKNPMSTEFLTRVLTITTDYIRNPNDEKILRNYNQMTKEVEAKYGRYAKLTGALMALPAAIFIGGTIGIFLACTSFPPLWPIIATCSIVALLALTLASTVPADKTSKIANAWDTVKTTFGR